MNLATRPLQELVPGLKPKSARVQIKRLIDLCGAGFFLCVLSPVFASIAIGVRWTTGGPVIFSQRRVGYFGEEFTLLKFRTMYAHCSHEIPRIDDEGILHKQREDDRVTRFGRWLRRTSLDELPQLINVLRGDMSLVGPRPLPKWMLVGDRELLALRTQVRPGMTGPWQTANRTANRSIRDMLSFDLEYVRTPSLRRDALILLRTVPAVIRGTGAF